MLNLYIDFVYGPGGEIRGKIEVVENEILLYEENVFSKKIF